MLQKNIIQPSSSPWASPVVLVGNKDSSLRFCVDYRKLNAIIRKNAYLLPRVDDSLQALSVFKWFSTMDLLMSGFWQVKIDKKDHNRKWTFWVQSDVFRVMQRSSSFPETDGVVRDSEGLHRWYCHHGEDVQEHLQSKRLVLEKLRGADLQLKRSKCLLFCEKVAFMSSRDMASVLTLIKSWSVPISAQEVQRFLGLAGYYRRYVQDFSMITKFSTDCLNVGEGLSGPKHVTLCFRSWSCGWHLHQCLCSLILKDLFSSTQMPARLGLVRFCHNTVMMARNVW